MDWDGYFDDALSYEHKDDGVGFTLDEAVMPATAPYFRPIIESGSEGPAMTGLVGDLNSYEPNYKLEITNYSFKYALQIADSVKRGTLASVETCSLFLSAPMPDVVERDYVDPSEVVRRECERELFSQATSDEVVLRNGVSGALKRCDLAGKKPILAYTPKYATTYPGQEAIKTCRQYGYETIALEPGDNGQFGKRFVYLGFDTTRTREYKYSAALSWNVYDPWCLQKKIKEIRRLTNGDIQYKFQRYGKMYDGNWSRDPGFLRYDSSMVYLDDSNVARNSLVIETMCPIRFKAQCSREHWTDSVSLRYADVVDHPQLGKCVGKIESNNTVRSSGRKNSKIKCYFPLERGCPLAARSRYRHMLSPLPPPGKYRVFPLFSRIVAPDDLNTSETQTLNGEKVVFVTIKEKKKKKPLAC